MERVLLLGNPGTGKSTLLNSLIGRQVFESGISIGRGCTRTIQDHHARGVTYIDTPGLADVGLRRPAAAAITKALRKHGTYRVFFVVILRGGRVQPEDVATINQVVSSIDISPLPFSVIINSVKLKQLSRILSDPGARADVVMSLNSGQHTTQSIHFLPVLPELDEAKNTILRPCPWDFVAFVENAPSVYIPPQRVRDVTPHDAAFQREIEQVQREIDRLSRENEALHMRAYQLQPPRYRSDSDSSSDSDSGGRTALAVVGGVAAVAVCTIM